MSSFPGTVKELQNVLIDNFTQYETHTCFFLSHCHTDHMIGISELLKHLARRPGHYLYCSPISHLILLNKYRNAVSRGIKELTAIQVIEVPENGKFPSYHVTVTPIPAGHCPGSVMFLFEPPNQRILYTGDFRIMADDVSKFKAFHIGDQVKSIDSLYLDATFLNETYWNFPARSELVVSLVKRITEWLSKDKQNNVLLLTSANYGYENLFVELSRKCNYKIHVKDEIYKVFWNVPEIGSRLTNDCCSTKIHASYYSDFSCKKEEAHFLTIKLSASWYKSQKGDTKEAIIDLDGQTVKACYATHSSCSELATFLKYLKPKHVEICTKIMQNDSTKEQLQAYTSQLFSSLGDQTGGEDEEVEPEEPYLPLERNYKFQLKFQTAEDVTEYFAATPGARELPP